MRERGLRIVARAGVRLCAAPTKSSWPAQPEKEQCAGPGGEALVGKGERCCVAEKGKRGRPVACAFPIAIANFRRSHSAAAPEMMRMDVKLAASMRVCRSASRQSSEFPAKASIAIAVSTMRSGLLTPCKPVRKSEYPHSNLSPHLTPHMCHRSASTESRKGAPASEASA